MTLKYVILCIFTTLTVTIGCGESAQNSVRTPNPSSTPDRDLVALSCKPADKYLVDLITDSLTTNGVASFEGAHTLKTGNRLENTYTLIAGKVVAQGLNRIMVFMSPSLDLDGVNYTPIITATDNLSQEFSIWRMPFGGDSNLHLNDKWLPYIRKVEQCVR